MKHLSSKHTFHGKKRHDFISLFSIFLLLSGLFVLVYLLSVCHSTGRGQAPFFQSVSAREQTKGEKISEAIFLSAKTVHRISLPPYSHKYYYINYRRNYSVQILSGSSSIKMTFFSENGCQLSIPRKKQSYLLENASGKDISSGKRIFLKFSSNTTKTCIVKVQYQEASKKEVTKKKQSTPRPQINASNKKAKAVPKGSSSENTSPSEKKPTPATMKPSAATERPSASTAKPSTATAEPSVATTIPTTTPGKSPLATQQPTPNAEIPSYNLCGMHLCIQPHFIRLAPGAREELSLEDSSLSLADCICSFTDPSIISVKNNIITGEKVGTTILYFQAKESGACGSCLIRVII